MQPVRDRRIGDAVRVGWLLIGAVAAGIISGLPSNDVMANIISGFGGTLGSIGIIIGFGVMMGAIFEVSGAAKRMALTFIKLLGKGKEDIAQAQTEWEQGAVRFGMIGDGQAPRLVAPPLQWRNGD